MNLLRCHILGFGKLKDLPLSFEHGLNLVFAPNEGGKSTLQRYLIAMLYGQLRPDLRTQRRLEPWVEEFKPWHGTEYGGALWCCLQNGRELEVRRVFGKDEARIEIRAATGEEITLTYEQQRNGEVLFARFHLGLPKDVFESIAVIRENRVAELNSRDTLRDRISNLAQSGDEEQSVPQSLGLLEASLEAIGSERAPTKPFKQTQDLIEALRAERQSLDARRLEFERWLGDRNRLSGEVQKLERQLQVARSTLMTARWREAAEKVRSLEELEMDLRNLRAEVESSDGRPDFPAHELDNLNHLIGAKENIDKRITDSARELEAATTRLQTDEANRAALAPYAALMESVETEKITEWFVKYMGTAFHRDEAIRSLKLSREEIAPLEEKLAALGPALSDPSVDWERCARDASEKERISSEQILIVAQRLSNVKELVAGFQRRTAKWRGFAAAGILLALAALGGWRFLGSDRLPALPAFAAAAALAVAGIVAFASSVRSRAAARPLEKQVKTLETERSHWRDESVKASRDIREAMDSSGFKLVEEFLDAAREARQWRQQLQMLRSRMSDLERRHEKVTSESAEYYSRLQETLAKVGIQCSPGTVKSKVDIVRANFVGSGKWTNPFEAPCGRSRICAQRRRRSPGRRIRMPRTSRRFWPPVASILRKFSGNRAGNACACSKGWKRSLSASANSSDSAASERSRSGASSSANWGIGRNGRVNWPARAACRARKTDLPRRRCRFCLTSRASAMPKKKRSALPRSSQPHVRNTRVWRSG